MDTDWFPRKGAKAFMWFVNKPLASFEYNFIGEAYEFIIQKPILRMAKWFKWVDTNLVNRAFNEIANLTLLWSKKKPNCVKSSICKVGISVLFIILVTILSTLCVSVSWKSIQEKTKEFFISLLIMETAMIGVFVSLNIFLFYLFWELTLIPMFLLIGVWGGSNRIYATIKFVLFTLAGSVLMLVGIIVLYYAGGKTFDILTLSNAIYPHHLQLWLFFALVSVFNYQI